MKRQIIKTYLKIIIVAVTASIVISAVLCFVLFFLGRSADNDMPQYLVYNIKPHISFTDAAVVKIPAVFCSGGAHKCEALRVGDDL